MLKSQGDGFDVGFYLLMSRNFSSRRDAGHELAPDLPINSYGKAQARLAGLSIRTSLAGSPEGDPLVWRYAHDGTTRSKESILGVIGNSGLPGVVKSMPEFYHDNDSPQVVRERIVSSVLGPRMDTLRKYYEDWGIRPDAAASLTGVFYVVTSQRTIGALVAPEIGIADSDIVSEDVLLNGELTRPNPNIPFGSMTRFWVGVRPKNDTLDLKLIHYGVTPKEDAKWASRGRDTDPRRIKPYGAPPKEVIGRRYSGTVEG